MWKPRKPKQEPRNNLILRMQSISSKMTAPKAEGEEEEEEVCVEVEAMDTRKVEILTCGVEKMKEVHVRVLIYSEGVAGVMEVEEVEEVVLVYSEVVVVVVEVVEVGEEV